MYKYIIISFFLFNTIYLSGKTKEYTQYDIDTVSYWFVNLEKAQALKTMLMSDNSFHGWSKYYVYKAYAHLKLGERDSAAYYSQKAVEVYENSEMNIKIAETSMTKAYYMIGLKEYFDDNKLKAIETLYKAMDFANLHNEEGLENWKTSIYSRIAILHTELGDFNLALKYKLKLLKFDSYMSYQYSGGNAYLGVGVLYFYVNDLDSAKYFLKKALLKYVDESERKIKVYFSKIQPNIVDANNFLGHVFYLENQLDSSIFYFKKAKVHFDKHVEVNSKSVEFINDNVDANHAYTLLYENKDKEAVRLLQKTKNKIDSSSDFSRSEKHLKRIVYDYLSKAYYKTGNSEKALDTKEEFINYLNDYENNEISKQLQQYTTHYELKEKEHSIFELEQKNRSQEIILKQKNSINWVLGILLVVLILFGLILIRQRRLKNRLGLVGLEQRLLRSQLNPHFIFNALNSISGLAHSNSKKTVPYILKFSSLLRLILKNSREEFISLNDEIQATKDYLELQSNFSNKFSYSFIINEKMDTDEIFIPPMFIQPFIENSIDHGLKGIENGKIEIRITLDEEKKLVKCLIIDNGIGYIKGLEDKKTRNGHESLSGTILNERLKLYARSFRTNAQYVIEDLNESGSGTQVNLMLPFLREN